MWEDHIRLGGGASQSSFQRRYPDRPGFDVSDKENRPANGHNFEPDDLGI